MLNSARNTKRDKKNQKIIFLLKLIKLGPSKSSHWKKGRSFVIQTALQIFEPFCGTIARWLSNYPFIKSMRVCVRKVDGLVFVCKRGCQGICENYPLSLEDVCWCAGLVSSNFWNKILLNLRVKMISYRYYQLLATNFNSRNYKSFGHKS